MKTKNRSTLRVMAELLKLVGSLRHIIALAVLGGWAGNACAIAVMTFGACAVAKLMDPAFSQASLGLFIGLTVAAGALRGALRFGEQYSNHFIAFKLLAALRDRIFGALRRLAPARLEGKQKGAVISMLTADVETLEVFYAHTISPILIALLTDGTAAVLVFVLGGPALGAIALAAYLVIGIVVPFASAALLRSEGQVYREKFSASSARFLDSVRGVRETVLYNAAAERTAELDRESGEMNVRTEAIKRKGSAARSLSELIVSAAILGSAVTGLALVSRGALDLPHMTVALVLLFSSFGPVLALAALPSNLTQTFAAGNRILDFMEEKPETEEVTEGEDFPFEGVRVEDLSFSYGEAPVLKHIDMTIRRGSITGLMGPSGCGKSTLLKLLLRFYDPREGRVLYGERDLRTLNTAALHRRVTMVSQDTWLFNDTILNNLRVARPDASLEEVREACRRASVDEFIAGLPQGYDTEAGLLGDSLSAGERQRIGLARAFLSGADLILLDEVTANVDAINEGIILRSLRECAGEKTIVLVSHRESTLSICTDIYRMEEGRLQA